MPLGIVASELRIVWRANLIPESRILLAIQSQFAAGFPVAFGRARRLDPDSSLVGPIA